LLASGAAQAAPEPSEAERLFYDGSAAYSAADYLGAIEKFTAALGAATREGADPVIRSAMLINLAESHERAFEMHEDVIHLKKANAIYQRIQEEAGVAGYGAETAEKAKRRQAVVRAKLDELHVEPEPAPDPDPDPEPPPNLGSDDGDDAQPAEQPTDPERRKHKVVGGALVGVGSVALAGGAALIANGARLPAVARMNTMGMQTPEAMNHIAKETNKGRALWATGIGVATAGVVMIAVGAVQLTQAKRSETASRHWSLTPLAGFGAGGATAGAQLGGRF
jgi:hypothetical protein